MGKLMVKGNDGCTKDRGMVDWLDGGTAKWMGRLLGQTDNRMEKRCHLNGWARMLTNEHDHRLIKAIWSIKSKTATLACKLACRLPDKSTSQGDNTPAK